MANGPIKSKPSRPRSAALAIALLYLLISCLWIAFSDRWVFRNLSPAQADHWSTLKGWAFAIVTASALYWLLLYHLMSFWRTEQALRESNARLRLAVEAAQMIVWEWDAKTSRITWDASHIRDFVPQTQPFTGSYQDFLDRIDPIDRNMVDKVVADARVQGAILDVEFRFVRPDEQVRCFWAMGRIRRDAAGAIQRVIGIAQDITDRKRIEEQLLQSLKMEAVGRLAGGIAHDFNNLLAVIIGYSESLLRRLGSDSVHYASVQEIDKAAVRASTLTQQLLAFSRRQIIRPGALDLDQVIRDFEPMLRQIVPDKIQLVFESTGRLPSIKADRGQIEQVLMNLVLNSRDAMTSGGGALTITTGTADLSPAAAVGGRLPPGTYLSLRVRDTGCGMTPLVRQRIFEPFFTTKPVRGTGLGLSIVYGIVQQAGGDIFVQSQPDAGSTFEVLFPLLAPPDQGDPRLAAL